MPRRLAAALAAAVAAAGGLQPAAAGAEGAAAAGAPAAAAPAAPRQIAYRQWTTGADFAAGRARGVAVVGGRLRIRGPVGRRAYADPHGGPTRTYAFGRWTSPWTAPGFGLTELVPSWDVAVRGDAWVQVQVRGTTAGGRRSSWDTVARWAPGDATFNRTSPRAGGEGDDLARVATDTWQAGPAAGFRAWQLRLTLHRRAGTRATPLVDTAGAVASRLPEVATVRASRPGVASGLALKLPRFSQMVHRGHYPTFGGGGRAWCSPTATSMVLGYYGALPGPREYGWVPAGHRNPWVDHVARMVYDYEYDGAGNWPFNTAYAAKRTGRAFVTRMRSLRDAERFIRAGIPVVASIAFGPGELDGAPIGSSDGHVLVIVGFDRSGNVIVNDPAAPRNKGVRRTYDRGQFENAWLPTSGGLAYVIYTDEQRLPARRGATNW